MHKVEGIEGLTVELAVNRIVRYHGAICPLIGRTEVLCQQNTSYWGITMKSTESYRTPIGVVQRNYNASGPDLSTISVKWMLVSIGEQEAAQKRFIAASEEMASARTVLEMLNSI